MVNDYAEQFFESMKIVAEYCYKDQKFDETINATIVDDKDYKNGRYVVSDGVIKFDAYSDSQTYRVNDVVRVTILKGDYSEKKYIVGKSVVDTTGTALTYEAPSDKVLILTDNLFVPSDPNFKQLELRANNTRVSGVNVQSIQKIPLWEMTNRDDSLNVLQQSDLYDSIVLKAKFKTLFNGYHMVSGSYGLCLDVYISIGNGNTILKHFYLDSSTMFGDPYNFLIAASQEAKFNISHEETIAGMILYAYQDNNFQYKNDDGSISAINVLLGNNIFISDLKIGMGNDLSNIEDNKVRIYTQDNLLFNTEDIGSVNNKSIGLIWYNKDENNNYIGFSDGYAQKEIENIGFDETSTPPPEKITDCRLYDELLYLEQKKNDDRLSMELEKKDVPNDILALNLSANLTELIPLFQESKKLIFTDLKNEINTLKLQLTLIQNDAIGNSFNDLLSTDGWFYKNNYDSYVDAIIEYYKRALRYAAASQNDEDENKYAWPQDGDSDYQWPTDNTKKIISIETLVQYAKGYLYYCCDVLEDADNAPYLEQKLINIKDTVQQEQISLISIYDSYYSRILTIRKKIQIKLNKMRQLFNSVIDTSGKTIKDDFETLKTRADENNFESFPSADYSQYDNLYCIYWYRYVEGYEGSDAFDEKNWQRISTDPRNIGLPTTGDAEDGKYAPKPADMTSPEVQLSVTLDEKRDEEKYRAIVIYNHEPYKSNEIVFTNARPLTDNIILNNIKLEHSTNSKEAYPLYGQHNQLLNSLEYNRIRYIQMRYMDENGEPNDAALEDAQVYWDIPTAATMLRYDLSDYDDFINYSATQKDGYQRFYKKINIFKKDNNGNIEKDNEGNPILDTSVLQFPYRIQNDFVPTYTNNTIYCTVTKGQIVLQASIKFDFSSFGTSGTNYTLTISPLTSQVGFAPIGEDNQYQFKFKVELYDYNNTKIPFPADPILRLHTLRTTMTKDTADTLIHITNDTCQDCVEGTITFGDYTTYAWYYVLEASIEVPWLQNKQPVTLTTLYSIPYMRESNYFAEGASVVTYDSFGSHPTYSKQPFKLYNNEYNLDSKKYIGGHINGTQWYMYNYFVNNEDQVVSVDLDKTDQRVLRSYLPRLSEQNVLIPSSMYVEDGFKLGDKQVCSVVVCKDATDKVLWAQPIVFTQNHYSAELLNNWDGSLQINNDQNYILSSMIGAGKKNSDNTFSGVLMGTVQSTSGADVDAPGQTDPVLQHDHTGIGLYGFHHGAQSFGFNTNGTAFIGKSGGGRISFDGTHGFIYSSNWLKKKDGGALREDPFIRDENTIKLNPGEQGMAIDLQNGHIDAYDFKLTSDGIKLNSIPDETDPYYLEIGDLNNPDNLTSSYIKYDKDGNLQMKVSSFELIGSLGGSNLLNNTMPSQPTVDRETAAEPKHDPVQDNIIKDLNDKSAWTSYQRFASGTRPQQLYVWSALQGRGSNVYKCIGIDNVADMHMVDVNNNEMTTQFRYIYQVFGDNVLTQKQYILTGYVWNNNYTKIDLCFRLGSYDKDHVDVMYYGENGTVENPTWKAGWNPIKIIFNLENKTVNPEFYIFDYSPNKGNYAATYFRELKLEEGSIATSWSVSEFDIENYTQNYAKDYTDTTIAQFNESLNQEAIFNKLTKNKLAKGIYLSDYFNDDGYYDLLINADYIATGILTSNNWSSTFIGSDNKEYGPGEKMPDGVTIADIYSENGGTYLNLNTGNFVINNEDNSSYIKYINNKLSMKVDSFELTGGIGGSNLIHETEPRDNNSLANRWWGEGAKSVYNHNDGKKCIQLTSKRDGNSNPRREMTQYMDKDLTPGCLEANNNNSLSLWNEMVSNGKYLITPGKYVLSGYVYLTKNINRELTFCLGRWQGNEQVPLSHVRKSYTYLLDRDDAYEKWHYFTCPFEIKDNEKVINMFHIYDKVKPVQIQPAFFDEVDSENSTYFYHLKLEKGSLSSDWCFSDLDIKNNADAQLNRTNILNKLNLVKDTDGIYLENGSLVISASGITTGIITSKDQKTVIDLDNSTFQLRSDNPIDNNNKRIVLLTNKKVNGSSYFAVGQWENDIMKYGIKYGVDQKLMILTNNFKINADGSGVIAGWSFNGSRISKTVTSSNNSNYYHVSMTVPSDFSAIDRAENSTDGAPSTFLAVEYYVNEQKTWPFYVRHNGYLKATNANISGTINATSGTIGGCKISSGVLQIKKVNIAEKLTVNEIDTDNLTVKYATTSGTATIAKKLTVGSIFEANANDNKVMLGDWNINSQGRLSSGNTYIYPNGFRFGTDNNHYVSFYSGTGGVYYFELHGVELKQS